MPPLFATAHALAFVREPGEDRLDLIHRDDALSLVVADGAGGVSGGARAAELLIEVVRQTIDAPSFDMQRPETCVELLSHADHALEADPHAGKTTGIVLTVGSNGSITGASCGDSGAWVVSGEGTIDDLTAHQHRKLRLGSGRAKPVPFSRPQFMGTLLVATDGLFNYARPERIAHLARQDDLHQAVRGLIRLVRLPNGGLQDDVGVILARTT